MLIGAASFGGEVGAAALGLAATGVGILPAIEFARGGGRTAS